MVYTGFTKRNLVSFKLKLRSYEEMAVCARLVFMLRAMPNKAWMIAEGFKGSSLFHVIRRYEVPAIDVTASWNGLQVQN